MPVKASSTQLRLHLKLYFVRKTSPVSRTTSRSTLNDVCLLSKTLLDEKCGPQAHVTGLVGVCVLLEHLVWRMT